MGTYSQGLLGGFSGKVGPIVGATWRGKQVVRTTPKKSKKPPTESQALQRLKFATAVGFLHPIKPLLLQTFKEYTTDTSGYDRAMSYHLKEALLPTPEGVTILYQKVLISMGDLRGLENPVLTVLPQASLQFSWANNSQQAAAHANDLLLVVAYLPTLQVYEVFKGITTREAGEAVLQLPLEYLGQEVMCWASFTTVTGFKSAVSTAFEMVVLG